MQISQWMKTFRQAILGSLTDLNYYVTILNTPVRFSFKVVAWFYLFLGLTLTGIFVIKDVPKINTTLNAIRDEAIAKYPDDLTFDLQDQKLTSSSTQPIVVPFPSATEPIESAPKNLAIIDPKSEDAPNNVSAVVYVNQTRVYVNSMQGSWTDAKLSDALETSSGHFDKKTFMDLAEASKDTQKEFIASIPWLALLFFSFGLFLFRMLSMLLNALIIQLLFQFLNKPLTYKKVFQLCLHVLIPAELVGQISTILFPKLNFPMFGLAFWLIVTLLIWHLRHLQVVRFAVDDQKPNKRK